MKNNHIDDIKNIDFSSLFKQQDEMLLDLSKRIDTELPYDEFKKLAKIESQKLVTKIKKDK